MTGYVHRARFYLCVLQIKTFLYKIYATWGRIGFDREWLGSNCSRVMTLSSKQK